MKKFLSLLFTAVLILVVTSCSKSNEQEGIEFGEKYVAVFGAHPRVFTLFEDGTACLYKKNHNDGAWYEESIRDKKYVVLQFKDDDILRDVKLYIDPEMKIHRNNIDNEGFDVLNHCNPKGKGMEVGKVYTMDENCLSTSRDYQRPLVMLNADGTVYSNYAHYDFYQAGKPLYISEDSKSDHIYLSWEKFSYEGKDYIKLNKTSGDIILVDNNLCQYLYNEEDSGWENRPWATVEEFAGDLRPYTLEEQEKMR